MSGTAAQRLRKRMSYNYDQLLERTWANLPEKLRSTSRFEIPRVKTFVHGKQTYIQNFKEITDALNRKPQHLLRFLSKELAAPAVISGTRVIIQRQLREQVIADRINNYAKEYVFCHECGRPDTKITEMSGEKIIKCAACGGWWPLKKIK